MDPELRLLARDVTARGVRMRVVETGTGAPLLLIHDLLTSHVEFEPIVFPLGNSLRVLAPDLPGFGESEKPSSTRYAYGVDTFAEAMVDLVAALELGRIVALGHGLGGAIAITLAAEHPELVEKLVLVAPLAYPFRPDIASRLATVPVVGSLLMKQLYGRRGFRRYYRESVFSPGFDVPLERIDRDYDAFNSPAARESAYATVRAIRDTRSVVARIPRVLAPTLIIWGDADRITPPSTGQRLAREIQGARLKVLPAGHAPHREAPADFVRTVTEFLAR
jgi:pimeloyl-ACP methyl ester carboxylesterase